MNHVKGEFLSAASPVARLLGHSLAVVIGFAGLALISLLPIAVVRLLIWIGMPQLAEPLHLLETLLLLVDIGLFGIVFLTGVVVFLVETLATTKRQIKAAWRDHG